jgi:GNAT superfamily N-acetyltransferase
MSTDVISYKVKKANATDIFDHLKACNDNFIPPLDQKVDLKLYAQKIMDHAITFEAWENNILTGLVAAYLNDEEKRTGFITSVSVLPGYGARGIASQLLNNCTGFATEGGFEQLQLEVDKRNMQAISLYKKHKFETVGETGDNKKMKLIIK